MEIEKSVEKLDKYFRRLEDGKAQKIKANHVEKIIRKLHARVDDLQLELKMCEKEEKKTRLARKVEGVQEQITRARWLLKEIGED